MRYQMANLARRVTVTRQAASRIEVTTSAMTGSLLGAAVGFFEIYIALGVACAVPFVTIGVQRVDAAAAGSSWGFRLLILPGTVLLWPLLLFRWASGSVAPPVELNAHRRRARSAP
jgi:hypothetical protein